MRTECVHETTLPPASEAEASQGILSTLLGHSWPRRHTCCPVWSVALESHGLVMGLGNHCYRLLLSKQMRRSVKGVEEWSERKMEEGHSQRMRYQGARKGRIVAWEGRLLAKHLRFTVLPLLPAPQRILYTQRQENLLVGNR